MAPDAKVVYADNDPVALTHARAPLTSSPEGATAHLDADLRDPDTIVQGAARTLDFTQPIAIMLMGILGHIADDEQAQSIVKRLWPPCPPAATWRERRQRHQRGGRRGGRRPAACLRHGHADAFSLMARLGGIAWRRPMTYQFVAALVQALGGRVRQVQIDRVVEDAHAATVEVERRRACVGHWQLHR